MCGIFGFIGAGSVKQVMGGLARLEYRGYDSAGIAYLKNGDIKAIKAKGQVANLASLVEKANEESCIALGHTRWATHGRPNEENCHPHISDNKMWAVVHNGIIDNYDQLKRDLKEYPFKSQTDSEVVVALLEKMFDGNPLSTLKKVCQKLAGSYAFGVIYKGLPDRIFVARKNSPVVVGFEDDFGLVCSDVNSLGRPCKAYVMGNDEFAVVKKGEVEIFNQDLCPQKVELSLFAQNADMGKGEYPHFMLKEIKEIPLSIEKTVCLYNNISAFQKALPLEVLKSAKEILVVACGTAYHASLMGKKILESRCGVRVSVEIASEFLSKPFVWDADTLSIFVSQSGETADTLKSLRRCKQHGLKTLAITNVENSSICFDADYVLFTSAGKEVAVASTKAYNSQIAIFHMISAYFSGEDEVLFEESRMLCEVAQTIASLSADGVCQEIAKEIYGSESLYMIGRGQDYITAMESSLKLKEISYIHSEACPAGELKHGTISLITPQTYVFAFVSEDETCKKSLSNIAEVASRGGRVILFTPFDDVVGEFERVIVLPKVEEKYQPLIGVVYMQLVAYYTACNLNLNPDKPRSLAKSVTVE
ncbi:MAG: glutamine--fructose-6-phosphate transaminase (isomerizing) [Clostridia bacterium]|nr:glutamine--fructose-6-phosphate transaminase (isomerizing) [Clostridia bacterium]